MEYPITFKNKTNPNHKQPRFQKGKFYLCTFSHSKIFTEGKIYMCVSSNNGISLIDNEFDTVHENNLSSGNGSQFKEV